MGQIQTNQTDYLRQGKEQINFKRFDFDGTYIETIDENVLINCPTEFVPLEKSLVKLYEKPLKKAEFSTNLNSFYYLNRNAQFLSGSDGWILGTSPVATVTDIVNDTSFVNDDRPKALSGNKYLRTTNVPNNTTVMILNDHQNTIANVEQPLSFSFNYFINTDDSTEKYSFGYRVFVQETYNATVATSGTKVYNFSTKEWSTSYQNYYGRSDSSAVNSWGKTTVSVDSYIPSSDSVTSVFFGVQLFWPSRVESSSTLNFNAAYFDNMRLSEEYSIENNITSRRSQYSYAGTFTGDYKSTDNMFSNESKNNDFYIGKYDGNFRRPRDTGDKSMEQIVTQEILNDNRNYLTKYEGVFRSKSDDHIGLHKKVWIDFGSDLLQEQVSCYLDAVKYDVKASQYDLRMHVPNQDDDVGSIYEVILE